MPLGPSLIRRGNALVFRRRVPKGHAELFSSRFLQLPLRTRPELLLLQKTMVVVEGVARSLDPKLDMWTVADPVVREWMERHLGPAGRIEDAAEGAVEMGRVLSGVPGLMSRGAAMMEHIDAITRDGLVLSPETVAAIGAAEQKRSRWTTAALWAIAILLGWLVWRVI